MDTAMSQMLPQCRICIPHMESRFEAELTEIPPTENQIMIEGIQILQSQMRRKMNNIKVSTLNRHTSNLHISCDLCIQLFQVSAGNREGMFDSDAAYIINNC